MVIPSRIKLATSALARRIAPRFVRQSYDVVICSPGGVGTTFLMRHISKFRKTNDYFDEDSLKHLPTPPLFLRKNPKMIFISGNSEQAMQSIIRRGWLSIQGAKLGCIRCALSGDTEKSRAAYIKAVHRQKENYEALQDKVLFLDFEDIWSRKEDVAHFLGIEEAEFLSDFPERRERKTSAVKRDPGDA